LAVGGIGYLYAVAKNMLKRGIWLLFIILAGSCLDQPDCYELTNNYVGITFKKLYDGKADTLAILGITTPDSDSTFYPFSLATSLSLELNPFTNATDFQLATIYGTYRFVLGYQSDVRFVSEDCGISTMLSGLNINYSEFDSVRIINGLLTNPAQINIEASRCPRTNVMKVAFKRLENGVEVADQVQFSNVTLDYPVVYYFPGVPVSTVNIPLNPEAPTTTVTFEFADGNVRTLTVQHNRTPWNEYQLCSGLTLFDDLSNEASTFSQVKVVRDSVQDPPITNFAVYK
jgi:hypothetical protein